jgi:YHS domain-containing protein
MEPPPTLTDEGGNAPKATVGVIQSDAPPPPLPADEQLRANLPFAPAIGLDPVDGSKISIRAATPTCEYKGKTFYFNSEENKRTFLSKPDGYLKGVFASH